jgi:hypothetical protein
VKQAREYLVPETVVREPSNVFWVQLDLLDETARRVLIADYEIGLLRVEIARALRTVLLFIRRFV